MKKSSSCVLYEVNGSVATITLNRPLVKNAFNDELYSDLIRALRTAETDKNAVICIITGAGDYFSSGSDLNKFLAETFGSKSLVRVLTEALINFPKQLIAAVNGPAIGVGTTMLGLVDVVYAADRATFNTPFTSVGATPELCSSFTFPKIMGYSRAYEMLYFGKKLSAHEAKQCGLVSDVFPTDNFQREVQTRAREFATLPRNTLLAAKKLCRDVERQTLIDICHEELSVLAQRAGNRENRRAILKFFLAKM